MGVVAQALDFHLLHEIGHGFFHLWRERAFVAPPFRGGIGGVEDLIEIGDVSHFTAAGVIGNILEFLVQFDLPEIGLVQNE